MSFMKKSLLFPILISLIVIQACKQKNIDPTVTNRFISEQMSSVLDSEKHHSTYTVGYNSNGDKSTVDAVSFDTTAYGFSSSSNKLICAYDNQGYLMKSTLKFTLSSTSTYFEIKTTVQTGEKSLLYFYDTNNQLVKRIGNYIDYINGYLTGNATVTTEYKYDSGGKLATCIVSSETYYTGTAVIYETSKTEFTYNNGLLTKYQIQSHNAQIGGYSSDPNYYKFGKNGLLIQSGMDSQIQLKYEYDINNNRTKILYYLGAINPTDVYIYGYDTSPAPKSLIPKFKGHPVEAVESLFDDRSPNTVIKESYQKTDNQGNLSTILEIPYTVTYNSEGLVVSKIWRSSTNSKNYKNYIYTYQ